VKRTILIPVLAIAFVSCKPPGKPGEGPPAVYPYDLKVEVDSRTMMLFWKNHGEGLISGYNIYISETPLADRFPDGDYPESVRPHNTAVFPGDTNPEDGVEHYEAEGLQNGRKYYVSVRIVFPDRTLSRPSNEVAAVPGPRGELVLDMRYRGDRDGYSFAGDAYVRADDTRNDLYFFSLNGKNFLASPTRLNGFLRESRFIVLPFDGEAHDVMERVVGFEDSPTSDRVEVTVGDWILMRTQDGTHALMNVIDITGTGEERRIKFYFAVSALEGELFF
jgi:hypothetical protein